MGGGSSKGSDQNNSNRAEEPNNPNNQGQVPSPQRKQNYLKTNFKKTYANNNSPNHYNQAEIEHSNNSQSEEGGLRQEEVDENPFFESWPKKFQQNSKTILKIHILVIEPTYQIKNLNKKQSQHQAQLSWEYQYVKKKGRKTFLRFNLIQDGGYNLTFLLNEQGTCLEGDQTIWNIISPFRSQEQTEKVGSFLCERSYQSNEEQINVGQETQLDSELFYKWGEKPPSDKLAMKRLLKKKQMIENVKSQKGFEYSETAKYFTVQSEWAFSVLIEQKFNSFKSWIVEAQFGQDRVGMERNKLMSSTLLNDVETRKGMYIDEMKKKRDIIRESNRQQRD